MQYNVSSSIRTLGDLKVNSPAEHQYDNEP